MKAIIETLLSEDEASRALQGYNFRENLVDALLYSFETHKDELHQQSAGSGYGKSRLLLELAEQDQGNVRLIIYLSFATTQAYPKSTGSKKQITPDLLRCAYRRTAALVVDDAHKGIDWLIPVHLGSDKFKALVGQDKNRIGDSFSNLQAVSNEATHRKVTPQYYLTKEEKEEFQKAQMSLDWPAVLFAIDGDEEKIGWVESSAMTLRSRTSRRQVSLYRLDWTWIHQAHECRLQ
ncbi:unnamed protein product [Cylindrotheca closterium]|uniref:Uncharacterized protein n=1 Tax=Cylindrotheca closterium TaxID=2856 RepID=A0AAD2CRK8_9STRA|nr:unnamed protein product [Cylindrotheca closterium]